MAIRLNFSFKISTGFLLHPAHRKLLIYFSLAPFSPFVSLSAKFKAQNKLFDSVKATIFRQTMFAEFEEKVHAIHEEGKALSKDKLCDI